MESPSVLLKGMEGSSLGVWVAHGEGRAHFPDPASRKHVVEGGLAPVRYDLWGPALKYGTARSLSGFVGFFLLS